MENNGQETRQERREKKLRKKKDQIKQHGKGLANLYKNVVLKNAPDKKDLH